MLAQQIVNGLFASSIYALFAVGFTMIFGIMGVLNMAHGDFAMCAAFAVAWAVAAGFGPAGSIIFALILLVAGALFVERVAMRPGRQFKGDAAAEMPLIATIGTGMMLQNIAALIFGNKEIAFPVQLWSFVRIGDIFVIKGLIISAAVAAALLLALEYLVSRTDFGRQIRAVAQNRRAAEIIGINANSVIMMTVVITTLLAGVAGWLAGISYGLITPFMGIPYTIKGLVAMIVGGVGSLRGAVLGAILIGVVEAVTVTWLGSQSRDIGVFFVLLLALILRPSGLVKISTAR